MRDSLALNQTAVSSSSGDDEDEDEDVDVGQVKRKHVPPAGVLDDRLYCVCQSPHDDVSEMIGCDAPDCRLEWFHFECVGIMVPPEGKWYCPECSKRYKIQG